MSDRDLLMQQLVRHESLRLKPYTDTAGKITIGCGRNLTDCGISHAEAELLLNNDIDASVADLATFPWFPHLDAVRQRALVDLRFNVGWAGFLKFKKLIAAIGTGDYVRASEELMKSKIAPNRKQTLARMLATGIGVLLFSLFAASASAQIAVGPNSVLAWDVDASSVAGAQGITYTVTLDGSTVIVLTGVTCVANPLPAVTQTCSAPIAQIPLGSHSITMTASINGVVGGVSLPFAYVDFIIPIPAKLRFK